MSITMSVSLLPDEFEDWVKKECQKGLETRASFLRRTLLGLPDYQNWIKEKDKHGT